MATDVAARPSGRPRPWLLVALGVGLVALLLSRMFSGGPASVAVTTSAPPRQPGAQATGPIDPQQLDVRIEALKQPAVEAADAERNPFRFQPKAPPPPPPESVAQKPVVTQPVGPPPGPPGPPPIGNTIKFIGIVDTGSSKVGAFSDCKATFPGREGEIIEGRYRVVRIGVESAVLEYPDGRGRATLPLNGQGCVK